MEQEANSREENGRSVFDAIMDGGADTLASDYPWETAGWAWNYNLTGGNNGSPATVYQNSVNNELNAQDTVREITRSINGGLNGLEDRQQYFDIISEVF